MAPMLEEPPLTTSRSTSSNRPSCGIELESPNSCPELESGNAHLTLPKFVRNCRLLCQAIQARITPRSPRHACYQCQTGNGFRKIGGLSDRPSRRMSASPCWSFEGHNSLLDQNNQ